MITLGIKMRHPALNLFESRTWIQQPNWDHSIVLISCSDSTRSLLYFRSIGFSQSHLECILILE